MQGTLIFKLLPGASNHPAGSIPSIIPFCLPLIMGKLPHTVRRKRFVVAVINFVQAL